jgi:hypothetical protein
MVARNELVIGCHCSESSSPGQPLSFGKCNLHLNRLAGKFPVRRINKFQEVAVRSR